MAFDEKLPSILGKVMINCSIEFVDTIYDNIFLKNVREMMIYIEKYIIL